uniref:Uncharacterized protein n=1 Tax=Chromera velia CCMP2878 TaxID=1169474 RepID=A0A0G4H1C0_9ALVE|eukprot:Cvel_5533.t1-p1 / transcript=Cvel_5533.t1 / gene=Cvel_5533 / organism=Chromera_velia_CCMP2878 / gene_product=hypothetical protein / transcript_product=hypothetical protein / location=Cvel_scaffold259:60652-63327(+) / protein_length=892 / sequence_SO=supercontig / SO=protein_coding / is_pseudo=false
MNSAHCSSSPFSTFAVSQTADGAAIPSHSLSPPPPEGVVTSQPPPQTAPIAVSDEQLRGELLDALDDFMSDCDGDPEADLLDTLDEIDGPPDAAIGASRETDFSSPPYQTAFQETDTSSQDRALLNDFFAHMDSIPSPSSPFLTDTVSQTLDGIAIPPHTEEDETSPMQAGVGVEGESETAPAWEETAEGCVEERWGEKETNEFPEEKEQEKSDDTPKSKEGAASTSATLSAYPISFLPLPSSPPLSGFLPGPAPFEDGQQSVHAEFPFVAKDEQETQRNTQPSDISAVFPSYFSARPPGPGVFEATQKEEETENAECESGVWKSDNEGMPFEARPERSCGRKAEPVVGVPQQPVEPFGPLPVSPPPSDCGGAGSEVERCRGKGKDSRGTKDRGPQRGVAESVSDKEEILEGGEEVFRGPPEVKKSKRTQEEKRRRMQEQEEDSETEGVRLMWNKPFKSWRAIMVLSSTERVNQFFDPALYQPNRAWLEGQKCRRMMKEMYRSGRRDLARMRTEVDTQFPFPSLPFGEDLQEGEVESDSEEECSDADSDEGQELPLALLYAEKRCSQGGALRRANECRKEVKWMREGGKRNTNQIQKEAPRSTLKSASAGKSLPKPSSSSFSVTAEDEGLQLSAEKPSKKQKKGGGGRGGQIQRAALTVVGGRGGCDRNRQPDLRGVRSSGKSGRAAAASHEPPPECRKGTDRKGRGGRRASSVSAAKGRKRQKTEEEEEEEEEDEVPLGVYLSSSSASASASVQGAAAASMGKRKRQPQSADAEKTTEKKGGRQKGGSSPQRARKRSPSFEDGDGGQGKKKREGSDSAPSSLASCAPHNPAALAGQITLEAGRSMRPKRCRSASGGGGGGGERGAQESEEPVNEEDRETFFSFFLFDQCSV